MSVFLILVVWLRCAHQVAPTGGPPDKTPPTVIGSFPNPDSVGVKSLKYIEIDFSESIRQSTLPNNFWMIPALSTEPEIKWKGSHKVRFYLKDTLETNRTYVLTLSTAITDLRNNNLKSPFQLAFATGSSLDSGLVQGKIYSESPERDVYIYAYPLPADTIPDSLLYHKAPYFTQIDADNNFRMNYLPMGTYRLIALADKDYNLTYNIGSDLIGIPFMDVRLDSVYSTFSGMNFYLIEEDTTAPRIKSVDTLSTTQLHVLFDEKVKLASGFSAQVVDTTDQTRFLPIGSSFDQFTKEDLNLYFPALPAHRPMRLTLRGISDPEGNFPADSVLRMNFTSPAHADTTPPAFRQISPSRGAINVPSNDSIRVTFTAPVDSQLFRKAFSLLTEADQPVAGRFDFTSLVGPLFKPDTSLEMTATYKIQLELDSLKDLFGRPFPDTTLSFQFITINQGDLGEISGVITVHDPQWKQAIAAAVSTAGQKKYRVIAPTGKEYEIPFLPAGFYLTHAVVDVNGNGRWDRGQTSPWQFSEPFIFKPDTVKVRKRWTTQGVDFDFDFREKK